MPRSLPNSPAYDAPATRAPTTGARMNTQSWLIASQPANSAGPKERAGFTEVPLEPEGDALYPELDEREWVETDRERFDGFERVWLRRRGAGD